MSKYSKKRSASMVEVSDANEPDIATNPSKKAKSSAAGASSHGKDDDGNPFWEVRALS